MHIRCIYIGYRVLPLIYSTQFTFMYTQNKMLALVRHRINILSRQCIAIRITKVLSKFIRLFII